MNDWIVTTFENHVDLLTGFPFKSEFFTNNIDDIPLVKGDNLHQQYIDWETSKRWNREDFNSLKKYHLQTDDIVLAMDRPWIEAGLKYAWIKKDDPKSLLVQRVSRLRGKNGLETNYLRYIIGSRDFTGYLKNIVTGVTVPHISPKQILSFKFKLPPLATQQKIASILSAYDELIENNKQRIKLLESMAEEIYKEWFVRLRFPNYENTQFVDGLPIGWEETKLEFICDFLMGQSPPSEFYNENGEGLPFHQGVTNFNSRFPNHSIYCTDLKRIADDGDILLSVRAPVGRINIANTKLVIGRGLCSIKHKKKLPNYCYYLLKDIFRTEDSFGNGSVFNSVSKNELFRIKVINPPLEICEKFQDLIQPFDEEIKVLSQKNQLLQQTRDLLLPRLISGKLRVEEKLYKIEQNEVNVSMAAELAGDYEAK